VYGSNEGIRASFFLIQFAKTSHFIKIRQKYSTSKNGNTLYYVPIGVEKYTVPNACDHYTSSLLMNSKLFFTKKKTKHFTSKKSIERGRRSVVLCMDSRDENTVLFPHACTRESQNFPS